VNQDVSLFASILDEGQEVQHVMSLQRYGWLQSRVDRLISMASEWSRRRRCDCCRDRLKIRANEPAEVLLFDLA
jgi:hypothetical protein